MCTTLVLDLSDFNKNFVLDCYTSRKGIGDFLMQDERPLDFTIKQFFECHFGQSTYENEMLAIMHDADLKHPYLLGQFFQIKIDHQSLKYFLEQIISSPEKKKWATKMFGYDYDIIYKK
jgi:hypothetical protein